MYNYRLKAALNRPNHVLTKTCVALTADEFLLASAMILKSLNKDEIHLCIQQLPTGEANLTLLR